MFSLGNRGYNPGDQEGKTLHDSWGRVQVGEKGLRASEERFPKKKKMAIWDLILSLVIWNTFKKQKGPMMQGENKEL